MTVADTEPIRSNTLKHGALGDLAGAGERTSGDIDLGGRWRRRAG